MKDYLRKRWKTYWETKSWFSKFTDLLFILLVIAMLIPASRKNISAFAAGLMAGSPKTLATDKQIQLDQVAYQWRLQDADGNEVQFADLKGKVVFLNFWATWCPPCIAEMPDIQDFYDSYGEKVSFLLVTDEAPETVEAFMTRKGYQMPIYYHRGGVPAVFATNSIPTSFLINPDGRIVIRKTGAAKWNAQSVHQLIDQMLAE